MRNPNIEPRSALAGGIGGAVGTVLVMLVIQLGDKLLPESSMPTAAAIAALFGAFVAGATAFVLGGMFVNPIVKETLRAMAKMQADSR